MMSLGRSYMIFSGDLVPKRKGCSFLRALQRKERKRIKTFSPEKKYYFQYFVNVKGKTLRVCRDFFLSTYDVSQQRVYYAHKVKDPHSEVPATRSEL
jgi:hypothetical protein